MMMTQQTKGTAKCWVCQKKLLRGTWTVRTYTGSWAGNNKYGYLCEECGAGVLQAVVQSAQHELDILELNTPDVKGKENK